MIDFKNTLRGWVLFISALKFWDSNFQFSTSLTWKGGKKGVSTLKQDFFMTRHQFPPSVSVTPNYAHCVTVCLSKRQKAMRDWHFGTDKPPGSVFQPNTVEDRMWKDLESGMIGGKREMGKRQERLRMQLTVKDKEWRNRASTEDKDEERQTETEKMKSHKRWQVGVSV